MQVKLFKFEWSVWFKNFSLCRIAYCDMVMTPNITLPTFWISTAWIFLIYSK